MTADVDITIRVKPGNLKPFCKEMEIAGFRLRIADDAFVERTRVLPFLHLATQAPLDVVLAGPGPEETFLERVVRVDLEGLSVPVASPEDIIVMKLLAGRPKDLEDIRNVLAERFDKLDLSYMRSMTAMLEEALGQSDLVPVLEAEIAYAKQRWR
jgi:hypothetical protein